MLITSTRHAREVGVASEAVSMCRTGHQLLLTQAHTGLLSNDALPGAHAAR